MADLTSQHDRLIADARSLRDDNRSGGRHRRAVSSRSIGEASRKAKRDLWVKRLRNIAIALFAIWATTGVLGIVLNGIGFVGVMALLLCMSAALYPASRAAAIEPADAVNMSG